MSETFDGHEFDRPDGVRLLEKSGYILAHGLDLDAPAHSDSGFNQYVRSFADVSSGFAFKLSAWTADRPQDTSRRGVSFQILQTYPTGPPPEHIVEFNSRLIVDDDLGCTPTRGTGDHWIAFDTPLEPNRAHASFLIDSLDGLNWNFTPNQTFTMPTIEEVRIIENFLDSAIALVDQQPR